MGCNVVLGRDFLKACGLEINLKTLKIISVESTETQDYRKIGSIFKVPWNLRKELSVKEMKS